MDFETKKHFINHASNCPNASLFMPKALPPISYNPYFVSNNSPTIVIILVGLIMVTSLLLMAYYTFIIKYCLNWNNVDLVRARGFSLSRQRENQSSSISITSEPRGLDQEMINSIPMIHYKTQKHYDESVSSECAFCLSEFQQDEKLRVIPNCNHLFHIDCVDVWLQNNANCPICRRKVSLTREVQVEHVLTPRPSPYFQSQNVENIIDNCEDFVVIDLDYDENEGQNLHERRDLRGKELEVPSDSISPSHMKKIKLQKVISMKDECISVKDKDDGFLVKPIRRSLSMDVLVKKSSYYCGDSSSRVKRSFFSFGHGSRSRNSILTTHLNP